MCEVLILALVEFHIFALQLILDVKVITPYYFAEVEVVCFFRRLSMGHL